MSKAIEIEMKQVKTKELELLLSMANTVNDVQLRMGRISGSDWVKNNSINYENFLNKLKDKHLH